MKRFLFILSAIGILIFGTVSVSAQTDGGLSGIGNNTGSGSFVGRPSGGSSGSSSSGSSSSGSSGYSGSSSGGSTSTGSSSGGTALESTADTPTFQGFQELGSGSFVGRPSSGSPFIGRTQSFDGSRTPSNRQVSSGSTTRRTTSSRTSSSRTSMGRTSTTGNNNSVRAATSTEFAFSPMEVGQREASFRTRMGRLPNFRVVPSQIQVNIDNSRAETVAVVKGTVSSERDRKLIRQLLLLEPGIDKVDNQLVVRADSKSETLPTFDPAMESPAPATRTTPLLAPSID